MCAEFDVVNGQNNRYKVLFQPLMWYDGLLQCRMLSPRAHMVVFNSIVEQNNVSTYLKNLSASEYRELTAIDTFIQ